MLLKRERRAMNADDLQNAEIRLYVKKRRDGRVSFFYCLGSGPHRKHWTTSSLSHLNVATQNQICGFLTQLLAEVGSLLQSNSGLVVPSSSISSSATSPAQSLPSETLPSDTQPTMAS